MRDKKEIKVNQLPEKIVFFDGVCGLCDGFVQFVAARDKAGKLAFSPLQGETAKRFLAPEFIKKLNGMAFADGEKVHYKSDAAIRILSELPRYKFMRVFLVFPLFVREMVYNFVAKNRYKWFGKKQTCSIAFHDKRVRILG